MIITSKYDGTCTACDGAIAAGERVSWVRGVKGVKHAACTDEGRAVDAMVAESKAVDADIAVPAPEGLDYLPYQRAGIAYAASRKGTLIGDEMGLGKTIQALGAVNANASIRSVLVICPASLKLNWAREAEKWLVRAPAVAVVNGKAPPAGATGAELEVVIANYDVLRKHVSTLSRDWDLVIVDEVHYCKNGKAQRSKLTRELVGRAKRVIALTGTPITNRPIELWPVLQMIDPGHWDPALPAKGKWPAREQGSGAGFMRFAKRYCAAHRKSAGRRYVWDFSGSSNLPELQERLRTSCMVRRLKADVLTELPVKRRQIVTLPDNSNGAVRREREAWEAQEGRLEDLRVAVELARASEDPEEYTSAVAALTQGTQAAFAEISMLRHVIALSKVAAVASHVKEALDSGSAKVVLFAHHKDVIAQLAEALAEHGVVTLTGDTPMQTRQDNVDRFQSDDSCRVFIGSITAAGVGLTLTAAAHVVFAELDWVPGNVSQAEDRCHRIGQHDSVLVQHLVLDGSLDARMARILVQKQDIADRALDKVVEAAAQEPALPTAGRASTESRRSELDAVAAKFTDDQVAAIHVALRRLATVCDGAQVEDGHGFNKLDTRIGHDLAQSAKLSKRQAALGQKLVRKYRRQLGDLVVECGVAT